MHPRSILFLLLSHAAFAYAQGMPDQSALEQEMAKGSARMQEALRQIDQLYRSDPSRPTQSTPRLPDGNAKAQGADPLVLAERYRRDSRQRATANEGAELLAFVSFGMPKASLERLAVEASRAGATLVFRGLKDDSLQRTLAAFEPLAKLGASAILHPEAFRAHGVQSVPVYVLAHAGEGCAEGACREHLRLAGDVSLEYALERMARQPGRLGAEAEARLKAMRGL